MDWLEKEDPSNVYLQRGAVGITGASALETEKHFPDSRYGFGHKNVCSWNQKLPQPFWNRAGHRNVRTSDPVSLRRDRGHKERIQTGDKKLHA